MIQALLVTVCLAVFPYQGNSIILESGKVNNYEVVYPQKVSALSKGGIPNAQQKSKYEDTMQYEFQLNGEPVVLHLERNKGLFSEDYTETHYSPDDREITTSPSVQDHCYYHGYVTNEDESTAAISACDGLKGHFKHQGETYLIEPLKFSNSEAHAVYKYADVEKEDETLKTCGVTQTSGKSDGPIKKNFKRSLVVTPEEAKFLETKKYVEFYLVVDNVMYRKYTGNLTAIKTRVYESVNFVNTMCRPLNVHVAMTGLEIWSKQDKIDVQSAANVTLDLFGKWRKKFLLPRKKNDNTQLLTGVNFNGPTVGLGYVAGICSSENSAAVVQDHSKMVTPVASAMAHELGHNLGIHHDPNSCKCNGNPCIMAPSIGFTPHFQFSSCSIEEYWKYLLKERPQCILNKPLKTDIDAPAVCGNNFVEVGEECDCGPPQVCQSHCCNATTCKLTPGSQCDAEECCEQCKIKGAGKECRAAKDDCDLPERCTGQSAECPTDRFQRDGHPCQNNQGYCYHGTCPTLANQCIKLFGPDEIVGPDGCFNENTKGSYYGYCRRENGVNRPCKPQDVKCGRLYCTPKNKMSCDARYTKNNPNYGMVEPGTKCADGKVCSNGQCVNV